MTQSTESNPDFDAGRRRELLAYRILLGVLLLVVVVLVLMIRGCAPSPEAEFVPLARQPAVPPSSHEAITILDMAERVVEITRTRPQASDTSETYFSSPQATVHMHVVGFEQTVPRHIHRETHEATVIVSGEPDVVQIFGRHGNVARLEGAYTAGSLIYSPPYCGHKWVNRANDAMQGNLVFAAPPFDGNFYVEEADPRMLEGGDPFVYDPDAALKSLAAEALPHSLELLPIMEGMMSSLLVRDHASFESDDGPIMAYVTRGEGTLDSDREYAIGSRDLIAIPPLSSVEIQAREGSPLAILLFRPFDGPVLAPAPAVKY